MDEPRGPSLAGRAVLAVILMVGFYVLALGIAGALLFIPWAEWHYAHRIHAKLLIACIVGAGLILFSILPRRDRFVPPGPRLDPRRHPRLFDELKRIATATGQALPSEAYLEPDVNAWVSQRGGFMGMGGTRVMAVELPLLRVLTVSQLRGVLGHEFGHYHGGDTKLGPWIYKTREALFRTLSTLAGNDSILRFPFIGYAKLFFRVSSAISRRQELAADRLAARIVGAKSFGDGLRAVHEAGLAYEAYLENELFPVLNMGHRPPVAEGFARFLSSKSVSQQVETLVQKEMKSNRRDPYLTHPPLAERLQALSGLPEGTVPADDPPAISLLGHVDELEVELLHAVTGSEKVLKLKTVSWDEMGDKVFLPMWRERALESAPLLQVMTPASFPDLAPRLAELGAKISKEPISKEDARSLAGSTLSAALALALVRAGWSLRVDPGESATLTRGGESLEPFAVFPALEKEELTADAWRARCAALGIGSLDLTTPGDPPPASPPG